MIPEKSRTPLTGRSRLEREMWADEMRDRLTPLMSALSIVFVLVVVGESMTTDSNGLSEALTIAGWLIWLAFAAEFILVNGSLVRTHSRESSKLASPPSQSWCSPPWPAPLGAYFLESRSDGVT